MTSCFIPQQKCFACLIGGFVFCASTIHRLQSISSGTFFFSSVFMWYSHSKEVPASSDVLYDCMDVCGHWLTCAADVMETLLVWIHESFFCIDVSVTLLLMVSVLAIASVPVHVRSLTTSTPSPAFASISSRYWDANVNGLMVWGQIWRVT